MELQGKALLKKRLKIGTLVFCVFLILYLPSVFRGFYSEEIITSTVYVGSIEDSINADAYLVRDEKLLKSPFNGKNTTELVEGEKLRANAKVATILQGSSEGLLEEMKKIDLKIIEVQRGKVENQEFFSKGKGNVS